MVFTKVGNDHDTLHISYYETTLHKQGVVDLMLENPADCAKIHQDDVVDIPGLTDAMPGEDMTILVHHPDQTTEELHARHL